MVVRVKELGTARVSVTEEPDAGKPHVRICMGGFPQGKSLPCLTSNRNNVGKWK
jgi:hypothetical protein